eukprot:g1193.t1
MSFKHCSVPVLFPFKNNLLDTTSLEYDIYCETFPSAKVANIADAQKYTELRSSEVEKLRQRLHTFRRARVLNDKEGEEGEEKELSALKKKTQSYSCTVEKRLILNKKVKEIENALSALNNWYRDDERKNYSNGKFTNYNENALSSDEFIHRYFPCSKSVEEALEAVVDRQGDMESLLSLLSAQKQEFLRMMLLLNNEERGKKKIVDKKSSGPEDCKIEISSNNISVLEGSQIMETVNLNANISKSKGLLPAPLPQREKRKTKKNQLVKSCLEIKIKNYKKVEISLATVAALLMRTNLKRSISIKKRNKVKSPSQMGKNKFKKILIEYKVERGRVYLSNGSPKRIFKDCKKNIDLSTTPRFDFIPFGKFPFEKNVKKKKKILGKTFQKKSNFGKKKVGKKVRKSFFRRSQMKRQYSIMLQKDRAIRLLIRICRGFLSRQRLRQYDDRFYYHMQQLRNLRFLREKAAIEIQKISAIDEKEKIYSLRMYRVKIAIELRKALSILHKSARKEIKQLKYVPKGKNSPARRILRISLSQLVKPESLYILEKGRIGKNAKPPYFKRSNFRLTIKKDDSVDFENQYIREENVVDFNMVKKEYGEKKIDEKKVDVSFPFQIQNRQKRHVAKFGTFGVPEKKEKIIEKASNIT